VASIKRAIPLLLCAACAAPRPRADDAWTTAAPTQATAGPASCDVSTDEAAAAAFTALTGRTIAKRDGCISRSRRFEGLVRFGAFAYDYGCEWTDAIYRCRLADAATQQAIFDDAGWRSATLSKRAAIAIAWRSELEPTPVIVDAANHPEPKPRALKPPEVRPRAGGGLELRYWTIAPPGMQPGILFEHVAAVFDGDGRQSSLTQLDAIVVYHRHHRGHS
jgi:hypothetical protein